MKIDERYKINRLPFKLRVVESLDFQDEPILLLEKDTIGNLYLSYLIGNSKDLEQRAILQISNTRLQAVVAKEISIFNAFNSPENEVIYIADFFHESGQLANSYYIPSVEFLKINPIRKDYSFSFQFASKKVVLDENELLDKSIQKHKVLVDIYITAESLINSVKPFVISKIVIPIVEIIKQEFGFDNRNADKYLSYSHFRQSSFGVTLEINHSKDLFLDKESYVLDRLIRLFNAQIKEDFDRIISSETSNKNLSEYIKIIKALVENDANFHAAYANPVTKMVITSNIDHDKAKRVKMIIDESFETIEDVEEITGTFLEIDIDIDEPSFKVYSHRDEMSVKGKFDSSILERIKDDFINIGKEKYVFRVKTIYKPETTLRSSQIKRYMIDYRRIESDTEI